jgi:hypothetical protein
MTPEWLKTASAGNWGAAGHRMAPLSSGSIGSGGAPLRTANTLHCQQVVHYIPCERPLRSFAWECGSLMLGGQDRWPWFLAAAATIVRWVPL